MIYSGLTFAIAIILTLIGSGANFVTSASEHYGYLMLTTIICNLIASGLWVLLIRKGKWWKIISILPIILIIATSADTLARFMFGISVLDYP